MAENLEFECFSSSSNTVVARHPGRHSPGVLIQGDSLRIVLSEIDETIQEMKTGSMDDALECAGYLREKIAGLLSHYEQVLSAHNVELPYVDPVAMQATHCRGK